MDLKEKFIAFEEEFIKEWGEYIKLHDELNLYRGKEIGDATDKVNEIILEIQQTFMGMFPGIKFVLDRHQLFLKAIQDYNKFVDDIKKAGAVEVKNNEAVS